MKKIALILTLFAGSFLQVKAQDDFVRTPKGAQVKNFTNNAGDKIKLNDVVTFEVIQKTEKDSILYNTYTMHQPVKIQIQASRNVADLMDVLPLLAVKDSALVKIPTDSIFMGHDSDRPPFLPKGSNVIVILKIDRIQSLDDAINEQKKAVDSIRTVEAAGANKYIADHKLVVKTTPSGLKYFITQPSTKKKPLKGDTVMVNYTGRMLSGKVFDSSVQAEATKAGLQQPGRKYEPIPVVLGENSVIQGWEEGLLLLNEGSKAKFIIPSNLGYGTEGYGENIPPFSTLVFDIELVKIKPIKHAAPAVKPATKPAATKAPVKHTAAPKKKS